MAARLVLLFAISCFAIQASEVLSQTPEPPSLKERFAQSARSDTKVIGRLALVLVKPDSAEYVRADRLLRRGEKFRVAVSSNVDGWLYMFQRAETGELSLLWPRPHPQAEEIAGEKIEAKKDYLIPDVGVFVFNPKDDSELLYVVLNAEPGPPKLGNLAKDSVPEKATTGPITSARTGQQPTNYLIKDPFGGPGRGLTYDPGPVAVAPYLYFSSAPGDATTRAMLELKIRLAP